MNSSVDRDIPESISKIKQNPVHSSSGSNLVPTSSSVTHPIKEKSKIPKKTSPTSVQLVSTIKSNTLLMISKLQISRRDQNISSEVESPLSK